VDGKSALGWTPGLQEELQNAEQSEPDVTAADSSKRLASRFYHLKTGYCFTRLYWTSSPPQLWKGWSRLSKPWRAKYRNGSSESSGSGRGANGGGQRVGCRRGTTAAPPPLPTPSFMAFADEE